MSVLIKGMAMPKNCKECWNCDSNFTDTQLRSISEWMCLVKLKFVGETGDSTRPSWCPLVEVSTPHGRLIEEPKELSYSGLAYISRYDAVKIAEYFSKQIKNQPTVIEAEE